MSYVGAPYNFVPLGKKVYRKDEITKHSEISGLSGYLEYQVTAKTPIIVDGGDKHFYKNKDGKGYTYHHRFHESEKSILCNPGDGRTSGKRVDPDCTSGYR